MYALVDKLPKSPSTSKRPPPPPPPSEDGIDTQLPPALPERHDVSSCLRTIVTSFQVYFVIRNS